MEISRSSYVANSIFNKTENPSKDALHKADDSINPDNPLSLDPLSLDQL